jgi:hypothetical protein
MTTTCLKINIDEKDNLCNLIPQDGNKHRIIISNNEGKKVYYVKNINNSIIYFVKTILGTFLPLDNSNYDQEHAYFCTLTIQFLKSLSPDFQHLQPLLDKDMKRSKKYWKICPEPTMKSRIIKGFMQSKKTWIIISTALYYYIIYRVPVFIIIENKLSACEQLIQRIKEVFSKYMEYIGKNEMKDNFESLFKILDVNRGKKVSPDQFKQAIKGKRPRIFICLRSEYDLSPVNEVLSEIKSNRFAFIMDESDAIDNMSSSSAQEELNKLKTKASIIWNVTATAMTSLMKEDIDSGNVFIMKRPEHYKDLASFNMIKLDQESTYCDNVEDNPFEKDKNLEKYISSLSLKKPFNIQNSKHPVLSLIRVGTTIEPQLKISEYIHSKYGEKIVSITYNGSSYGITMRGNSLDRESITVTSKIISHYEKYVHSFFNCSIGDILQYLQSNGGVERYPVIVILAGKMADRGITFGSSNYSECMKNNIFPWHLTEMYYLAATGTDQPNLLQASGRLCGVYVDNIPLTLYSNACDDILKAYYAQEELIERARKLEIENSFMKHLIPLVEISKEKCAKRRFTSPNVNCKINKVIDDSETGGWDWKEKGLSINISKSVTKKHIEEIDNKEYNIYTVDPDSLEGSKRKVASDIIDSINTSDTWIDRAIITKKLVDKGYNYNSIKALMTFLQQGVQASNRVGYGINFRKKNDREIELLYHDG